MQATAMPGAVGVKSPATRHPIAAAVSFWRSLAIAARQTASDLDRAAVARGGFRASAARSD